MKLVQLLCYKYPDEIHLLIRGNRYKYRSSEFWCRRLINCLDHGAQFNALHWFKRVSVLVEKEVLNARRSQSKDSRRPCSPGLD